MIIQIQNCVAFDLLQIGWTRRSSNKITSFWNLFIHQGSSLWMAPVIGVLQSKMSALQILFFFAGLVLAAQGKDLSRKPFHHAGPETSTKLLHRTLDALEKGIHAMKRDVLQLNFDGVGVIRMLYSHLSEVIRNQRDQMDSEMLHRVQKMASLTNMIADTGMVEVTSKLETLLPGFVNKLGGFLINPKKNLWYPTVDTEKPDTALPCNVSYFNDELSNTCLSDPLGLGKLACRVHPGCAEYKSEPHMKGYRLTHQVLYWQSLVQMGCTEETDERLRIRLCSDVLRDAVQIAEAKFPVDTQDLFVEQISLCGRWGFREFANATWLNAILSWQNSIGCFDGVPVIVNCRDTLQPDHIRRKRSEFVMPDGCLAHKSTLALLALGIHLRFLLEGLV